MCAPKFRKSSTYINLFQIHNNPTRQTASNLGAHLRDPRHRVSGKLPKVRQLLRNNYYGANASLRSSEGSP